MMEVCRKETPVFPDVSMKRGQPDEVQAALSLCMKRICYSI